jgi:type VI secretion system protein ImpH
MAAAGRTPDPDLTQPELPHLLTSEPCRFGFFQAVRLLQRAATGSARVGGYGNPAREAVRFRAHPSLAFPASEIQSLEFREGLPPALTVNFMGLTGPLGVLPLHYTELVRERARVRDTAPRDFFDIFNHRLISLFYRAWEKYRPAATLELGAEDPFRERLYCFLGLGTPALRDRSEIPDESLLFNGGLLMMHTRPAVALEEVVRGYFGVPVEVEQFVGSWRRIEASALCSLGRGFYSERLGLGTIVGDEVWDAQSGVRLRLGPLTLAQYEGFLRGGAAHRQLRSMVAYFCGLEFSVELQLILRRQDVPPCELAAAASPGPRLGWTTWMKSAPFRRDPADLVFELH